MFMSEIEPGSISHKKTNYKNDRFNSIPFRIEGFGEQAFQIERFLGITQAIANKSI